MSPDEMKAAFQRYIDEAWNKGNMSIIFSGANCD